MTQLQPTSTRSALRLDRDPDGARQAYWLLRTVFTVAPIVFGIDKFFGFLADWDRYLAGWVDGLVPGTASEAMLLVGVVEIGAGVLVAVAPRLGAPVVALWLAGIVVNLVTTGTYLDVALRDVGLLVAALALYRLAVSPVGDRSNVGLDR